MPGRAAVVLTSLDLVSGVFYSYYMYICFGGQSMQCSGGF
jgi:hypothetical protein